VAVNAEFISGLAVIWRHAAVVASVACYVFTGVCVGMVPYSVELTRWAFGVFQSAEQ
jgi:hypothetical protein